MENNSSPRITAAPSPAGIGIAVSQGRRPYDEDRHVVAERLFEDFSLYGVFDGHGGAQVADMCRDHLPQLVRTALALARRQRQPATAIPVPAVKDALKQSILKLHEMIPLPASFLCGSTCLVALKRGDRQLWVANVGDSRAVLGMVRRPIQTAPRATVANLSRDHKPGVAAERRRISAAGGYVVDVQGVPRVIGELALSRAIGDKRYFPLVIPDPDITYYAISPGVAHSYLLLATDGLWDVMSSEDVDAMVAHAMHMSRSAGVERTSRYVAAHLMRHAYELRGAEDNMTVLFALL